MQWVIVIFLCSLVMPTTAHAQAVPHCGPDTIPNLYSNADRTSYWWECDDPNFDPDVESGRHEGDAIKGAYVPHGAVDGCVGEPCGAWWIWTDEQMSWITWEPFGTAIGPEYNPRALCGAYVWERTEGFDVDCILEGPIGDLLDDVQRVQHDLGLDPDVILLYTRCDTADDIEAALARVLAERLVEVTGGG